MRKLSVCLFLLCIYSLSGMDSVPEVSAYWDGAHFHECDSVPSNNPVIKGTTVYFASSTRHVTCYVHALHDGVFPLYVLLKKHSLLDTPVNLIIPTTNEVEKNGCFKNIVQLIKDVFKVENVILFNKEKKPENLYFESLIVHDNIPFFKKTSPSLMQNQERPKYFSYYRAYPESFEYINTLKSFGFVDNLVYQDTNTKDNLVKEFVDFILAAYKIDVPMKKNRVLISSRPKTRKILNEDELSRKLKRNGYEVIVTDFTKMSIRQQIIETRQSEYYITTHGSNLANSIFLKPEANVVMLWHKYGKYFRSRKYCPMHSAFLSLGIKLTEYDQPDYDSRNVYYPVHNHEYFYRANNINYLRPEKMNMKAMTRYPRPSICELIDMDLYIEPDDLLKRIQEAKKS